MIPTKGRYAIRLMVDLAEQSSDEYIRLDDIAERQEVSKKYLEAIVKLLVKEKLVVGVSGKKGGYKLTRDPGEYKISEILYATGISLSPVVCLEETAEDCPRAGHCKTLPMWMEFDRMVKNFFSGITLKDLAEGLSFDNVDFQEFAQL